MAGRYKSYKSAEELSDAVESYFKSISKVQVVKELVNTGRKDSYGHFVFELQPVTTDSGAPVLERIYHIPPTRGDLCTYLRISSATWRRYCNQEENPKFAEITEWAEDQLRFWRDKELLKRSGKNIRGLIRDMEINYGVSDRQSAALGRNASQSGVRAGYEEIPLSERRALLEEIAREFGGGDSNEQEAG